MSWSTTKQTKWPECLRRLRSARAATQSDQSSLSTWRWFRSSDSYLKSAQWRLLRLGGCPGWSVFTGHKGDIDFVTHASADISHVLTCKNLCTTDALLYAVLIGEIYGGQLLRTCGSSSTSKCQCIIAINCYSPKALRKVKYTYRKNIKKKWPRRKGWNDHKIGTVSFYYLE